MGVVLGLCSNPSAHAMINSGVENVDIVIQNANEMKDKLAHDSTVFGAKLDVVSKSMDQTNLYDLSDFKVEDPVEIPDVLLACIGYLKKNDRLKVRGLFRIPGDHFFILKLKQDISNVKNEPVTVDTLESLNAESHAVANVLKSFLKDLAEPLLTFELYSEFVDVGKSSKIEVARLEELLDSLPILHKNVTWFVLAFLAEVSEHEDSTQMSLEALAVIFAPNILRPRNETIETLMHDAEPKKVVAMALIRLAKEYMSLIKPNSQSL